MSVLTLEDLTMKFGGLTAVNSVDFAVGQGEILSVIGPNGAGKTTVFNAVTGIYTPSAGKVLFMGRELKDEFSLRTILKIVGFGILTGILLVIVCNIESLWQQMITSRYVYQQPFDWAGAITAAFSFLAGASFGMTWGLFFTGVFLGGIGSFVMWRRGRVNPELVMQRGVARTFQNIRLFREMSVIENIMVGMDTKLSSRMWHAVCCSGGARREYRSAEEKARKLLKFLDLEHVCWSDAGDLSYGQQRRLEIARALASEPKLILLDEPAAGMNPSESMDLMDIIRQIRDTGISVILIEHHMNLVMAISDRIVVLDYGNKIAEGTPQEIKSNPKVIEAYLGKESA